MAQAAAHDMRPADAHRLIVDTALGVHTLSASDLDSVVEHVARAGFDSSARERARGELAGMVWQGTVLRGRDRLPPAERHYLKHVVRRREWPSGTSLADYLRSLSEIILDPTSGVFTSLYEGAPQLGIIREARELRGPDGHEWVVID
jgi:hypothetical protein